MQRKLVPSSLMSAVNAIEALPALADIQFPPATGNIVTFLGQTLIGWLSVLVMNTGEKKRVPACIAEDPIKDLYQLILAMRAIKALLRLKAFQAGSKLAAGLVLRL